MEYKTMTFEEAKENKDIKLLIEGIIRKKFIWSNILNLIGKKL